jgi:hypothetical protein
MVLCLLGSLAGCGEDRDELAAERCKGEVRKTLGAQAKLDFPASTEAALTDDPVYGWHLDLEVEAKLGAGETWRAGYRCLFVVENRETPLFLAVVER